MAMEALSSLVDESEATKENRSGQGGDGGESRPVPQAGGGQAGCRLAICVAAPRRRLPCL